MCSAQIPFPLPHHPSYRTGDFVVGPANHAALGWLSSWPDWPLPYRGVNIYGPPSSGKTHLSRIFEAQTGAIRLTRLGPQDDMSMYAHAFIDDFDKLESIDSVSLLHFLNHVRTVSGTLLIFTTTPLARLACPLPDLASRLRTFTAQEIFSPDDSILKSILAKLFSDRQALVPDHILQYLVTRMDRHYLAAHQLVDKIDRAAWATKKPISLSLIRDCLDLKHQQDFHFTHKGDVS